MYRTPEWVLAAVATGLLGLGCGAVSKSGAGAEGAQAPPVGQMPANITRCGPDGLIDDGEDGNNQVAVVGGRAGYWYSFLDNEGSTIEPAAGSTFAMTSGGANGSGYAARVSGSIPENAAKPYAGVGLNFVDPKDAYDASKYGGIAFFAKKAPDTWGKIRIKLPDVNTDPQGGVCKECFNDFSLDIELTDSWVEYAVTWDSAQQMPHWGNPRPPKIDASKLYGFQVQVNRRGEEFDIWVDDVSFIGCGK